MAVSDIKKKLGGKPSESLGDAQYKVKNEEKQHQEYRIGMAWGEALETNTTLIHLDISNNHIGEISCRVIASKIIFNHTMFGIHIAGNSCFVDSYGFLVFAE